jgi:hypothetical protein
MPVFATVMFSTTDVSATQPRPPRQSKPTLFTPESDDEPWSEYSSPIESEKESDRGFISEDGLNGSEDEYDPQDDSSEDEERCIDSSSQCSDTDSSDENQSMDTGSQYDYTDSSDDDLSKIPIRVVSDASATKENKIAKSEPKLLDSVGSAQAHRRAIPKANR